MKKPIIGLVCLNALLAGYLIYAWAGRPAAPVSDSTEPASASAAPGTTSRRSPSFLGTFSRSSSGGKFSWDSLVAADLRQFAANLRSVQCPEETIKDIMLAEINRLYGPQERALKVRPEDVPPWEMAASYDRKSSESKLRQLLEEKRALLKEMLGMDVALELPTRLAGRDVEKFETGFKELPEAKRDLARAIQEKYWQQSDDIKGRTMGFLEPEDREEFARIKNERRTELAKVLTPRELEDFEMRTSATAATLKSRMDGFKATDEELRKVFNFLQPLDEEYSLGRRSPDPEDKDFTARRTQAEQSVAAQIQAVLGEERYAEYQRTRDPVYRNLASMGEKDGLPAQSIVQVYEAQKLLKDESLRIMRDPNIPPEQRTEAMQALRGQAETTMRTLLGDKGAEFIQRYGLQPGEARGGARRAGAGVVPQIIQ